MRFLSRFMALACVVTLLVPSWSATAQELEIVRLRHRTLDQVLPVLQSLVEQGGAVTGMQDQVIMRASARNIAQLKQALAALDVPARSLVISVRQGRSAVAEGQGGSVTGSVGTGGAPGNVQGRVYSSRTAADEDTVQQVRTVDGMPAFIALGQSVPVQQQVLIPGPRGYGVGQSTTYREFVTGFSVTARLVGERVTLEIQPRRDTPGTDGGGMRQNMATTVSGRLGEWLPIGALAEEGARDDRRVLSSTSASRTDTRHIAVRVDEGR